MNHLKEILRQNEEKKEKQNVLGEIVQQGLETCLGLEICLEGTVQDFEIYPEEKQETPEEIVQENCFQLGKEIVDLGKGFEKVNENGTSGVLRCHHHNEQETQAESDPYRS